MIRIVRIALLFSLLTTPLVAQEVKAFINGEVPRPVIDAKDPLNAACDGGWIAVQRATYSGAKLGALLRTPAGQAQAQCLIKAIDAQPGVDALVVHGQIGQLVAAYGVDSLDFFAAHADEGTPRASNAVWNALTGYGQPDAIGRYFAKARQHGHSDLRASYGSVGFYRPLLAGGCLNAVCSPRLNESLGIVAKNLDVADAELRSAESAPASSADPAEIARTEEIHRAAHDLRTQIGRIIHGETALAVKK